MILLALMILDTDYSRLPLSPSMFTESLRVRVVQYFREESK